MPLDEHIKRRHREGEAGVEILPDAVHHLLEVALRHEVARLIVWHAGVTRVWVEGRRPCCLTTVEFRPAPTRTGRAPFSASGGPIWLGFPIFAASTLSDS